MDIKGGVTMIEKTKLKTTFGITKNISLMVVLYSTFSKIPSFLLILSALLLTISYIFLLILRKEKSSYILGEKGLLEKLTFVVDILVVIVSAWLLISILFIN